MTRAELKVARRTGAAGRPSKRDGGRRGVTGRSAIRNECTVGVNTRPTTPARHGSLLVTLSVAVRVMGVTLALVACDLSGGPSPPSSPPTAVCGNGVRETGEECDDANADNADGCLTPCQRPVTWIPSEVHIHSTGCTRR